METVVVTIGAGPSGLAVGACLNLASISNVILERDDCSAPLWRKRCYDSLHLHLSKDLCHLPHMPHSPSMPRYIPKDHLLRYLDDYASHFSLHPRYRREVISASYDAAAARWRVTAVNSAVDGELEDYLCQFLVIATGENDAAFEPDIPGIDTFPGGDVLHSSLYRNGKPYANKRVLVVGAGNSGMEIAFDLCEHAASGVSILARSPTHIVSKEIWHFGIFLSRFLPLRLVDAVVLFLSRLKFGDTSRYGIERPEKGPFYLRIHARIYPVFDVGTAEKIKSGEIQVLNSDIKFVSRDKIVLDNGKECYFDAIILATGYRSTVRKWLKDDGNLIGEDGMAKNKFPNHWKGRNGLYCAGLAARGFPGSSEDAKNIASDIMETLKNSQSTVDGPHNAANIINNHYRQRQC